MNFHIRRKIDSNDAALAKGLRNGQRQDWDRFYGLYATALYRFALGRVYGNEDIAAEVTQETIVTALEIIGRFDPQRGTMWSWLCGILVNKCREQNRREEREHRIREAAPLETTESGNTKRHELALSTLAELHPNHQEVLELKYLQGLRVQAIAAKLSTTEKAIESRLTRARAAFRRTYPNVVEDF